MQLSQVPVDLIISGENVREASKGDIGELMKSTDEYGLLSPILVVPAGGGRYRVIAGHRRLLALQMRGETHIPCLVRTDISPHDEPFIQLIENTQRKDMDPEELVRVFDTLIAKGMSMSSISRKLGKSDGWVWDQYLTVRTRNELRAKGELTEEQIKKVGVTKAIKMLTEKNRARVPFVVETGSQGLSLRVLCRDEKTLRKVRVSLGGLLSSMMPKERSQNA
jgi:ParB/RepB/Spo0J family partition protein